MEQCGRSGDLGAHSLSKHATVRRLPKNLASISWLQFQLHSPSHSLASVSPQQRQRQQQHHHHRHQHRQAKYTQHTHSHTHTLGLCRLRFASFVHFSLNIAYLCPTVPRSSCPTANSAWHFMHFSSFSPLSLSHSPSSRLFVFLNIFVKCFKRA